MPKRVQLRRSKGWRLPADAVKVSRPGKWGNPFSVEQYDREMAIQKYESWLDQQLERGELSLMELRGRDLACWCSLDERCHADVLLLRANQ